MPIYEYSCEKCHKVFEEWTRRVDDNVSQTCPECGGSAHRIVSNTSFVLKGGGWYVTEYGNRKAADGGAAASAPGSSAGSESSGAPGGDSSASKTATESAPTAPKAESAPAAAPAQTASSGTAS